MFPPVRRRPGEQVEVTVAYNRAARVVRWLVDDTEVARVSTIGFPAAGATTIIEHGGTPQLASPRQLNCGMALFTLLDGGLPPAATGPRRCPVSRRRSSCCGWWPGWSPAR